MRDHEIEFEDGEEQERDEGGDSPQPKFKSPASARRRVFLSFFYHSQVGRLRMSNGLKGIARAYGDQYSEKERTADEERFLEPVKKMERDFLKVLKGLVEEMPIAQWLTDNVRGVAWSLAGQLVAIIGEIALFPRVSNLWSYAGLKPTDRRRVGVRSGWNPELKRCLYNFAVSAVKQGGFYAQGYSAFKAREERKANDFITRLKKELGGHGYTASKSVLVLLEAEEQLYRTLSEENARNKARAKAEGKKPPATKPFSWKKYIACVVEAAKFLGYDPPASTGELDLQNGAVAFCSKRFGLNGSPAIIPAHRHNRALRKIEKLLLQHLWVKWRELEGLPVTDPWVFTHGGHDREHLILPPEGKEAQFPMHLVA